MRILIHSNAAHAATGYGVQTGLFAPRFQRLGHDVAVSAFYGIEGATLNTPGHEGEPILVYPKGYMPYGEDTMGPHGQHYQADIILSLIDAWVMKPDMLLPGQRWVSYYPVDMETYQGQLAPPVLAQLRKAYMRVAMAQYGVEVTEASGLDCEFAPHGYDSSVYKPDERYRREMRKLLNVPDDAYLVGMVAANKGQPARKSWPQQLEGFAAFQKLHPEAWLYMHTTRGERGEMGGVNLPEMCREFGINANQTIFADQYLLLIGGYPPHHMAGLFNAFDVLLNCSMGEGFGVPILEAQACGCPVIVGDWTAMPELCWEGKAIPAYRALKWYTPLAGFQWIVQPDAVTEALVEQAALKVRAPKAAEAARVTYDADTVLERDWKPILDKLEARIQAEKQPNRETRRRQARKVRVQKRAAA